MQRFGQAESGDQDIAIWIQQDVLGLKCTMDHAPFVSIAHCLANLNQKVYGSVNLLWAAKGACQSAPWHETGDQVKRVSLHAAIIEGQDVRMIQSGRPARCLLEALCEIGRFPPKSRPDDDHDSAIQGRLPGLVDRGHTRVADDPFELILPELFIGSCYLR